MDYLIGIAIGLAIAALLPRGGVEGPLLVWLRRLAHGNAAPAGEHASQLVGNETSGSPADGGGDAAANSLTARLYALDALIEPTMSRASHPRDTAEVAEFKEAVALLRDPNVSIDTVNQHINGVSSVLASAALAALKERPERDQSVRDVVAWFESLAPWTMYFALEYFLAASPRPAVGAPFLGARDWWRENVLIPQLVRDYLAKREALGDAAEFGPGLASTAVTALPTIRGFLACVPHPFAAKLIEQLEAAELANIDRAFLTSFGRFWDSKRGTEHLVEPEPWVEPLATLEAAARRAPVRSLLASGEPRVGKTSFLRLLGRRLEREGWTVFEASGADLMAGQLYFGQLEGRIQRAVEELNVGKKLIWYIPDILAIALSGTHQGQAASVLDQILPAITAGRLVVWSEASPAATTRLLRLKPNLRGLFEVARLEPFDTEETAELGREVAKVLGASHRVGIDPECVEAALSLAHQYLSAASFPGSALDLLKLTVGRASKGGTARIEPHDIVLTLSQLTGLPASILDSKERVDLAAVRAYFGARVIGQDEAVATVVERIAMLKAGLNDPGKPIGVFLFAGPTGTGKTELAKTLAEFLFGSAERMIRLDMSEFQTAESTSKILGSGDTMQPTDSLISLVRKQPFSVVLLDEFEKAHANIWDLFLQVFDDGRLTDTLGQVADFRHTIIILTSNLGAGAHRGGGLGFSPVRQSYSNEQVLRAVAQTFRPEFQNRLDKIIVFRELTRELMRGILMKELARVLDRRGLKDREWAVEWEASALEFLLEKGFSPEMGARPLKRAIDQYVVAPLAATIVEKRFPEGDQFVFVRSDGHAIQAEFVDPDDEAPGAASAQGRAQGEPPALAATVLSPAGSEEEIAMLDGELAGVEATLGSAEWEELKADLGARMLAPDFWSRPDRHETLSRLALMDRVKAAAATARSLRGRLADRAGKGSRELVQRLALQLYVTKEGIVDAVEAAPIEVVLQVEPTLERFSDKAAAKAWSDEVTGMYRAWASNRRMQLEEIAAEGGSGAPMLRISGFGAYRLLSGEAGLHVLERPDDDGPSRATVRVRIAAAPLADLSGARLRTALETALAAAGSSSVVVRRYRGEPAPLVRDMSRGWRSGRLDAVLRGDFDLIAACQE